MNMVQPFFFLQIERRRKDEERWKKNGDWGNWGFLKPYFITVEALSRAKAFYIFFLIQLISGVA